MVVVKDEKTHPMTHKELVKKAAKWLRTTNRNIHFRCSIVIAELVTANSEVPDVIGFRHGFSVLLECKATRSDFLSDKKKYFRRVPEAGMGDVRYFFTPKGLISESELPEGWGLLECSSMSSSVRLIKKSEGFSDADKRGELVMLASVIRRLEISTAVFVQSEDNDKEVAGE